MRLRSCWQKNAAGEADSIKGFLSINSKEAAKQGIKPALPRSAEVATIRERRKDENLVRLIKKGRSGTNAAVFVVDIVISIKKKSVDGCEKLFFFWHRDIIKAEAMLATRPLPGKRFSPGELDGKSSRG